jgi:hypothetical protein
MAGPELLVPDRAHVTRVVDDPPVTRIAMELIARPPGPRTAGVQFLGFHGADALVLSGLGGATGRNDRHEADVLQLGQLGAQGVDLLLPFAVGQRRPRHHPAVDQAVFGPGPPGAVVRPARRPACREPPQIPASVLGPADLLQLTVVQLDEAARRYRTFRDPAPPASGDRGHDRADLEDVVLPDEAVQLGPGQAGGWRRLTRVREVAQPVTLVPVVGHPGPGILRHLAVHEQGTLEGAHLIEDRAAHARSVRGQHEYRGASVKPGHPAGFVKRIFGHTADDGNRCLRRSHRRLVIQQRQQLVLPAPHPHGHRGHRRRHRR